MGCRLSLPRVGDIASGVVVRGDLRLPRFDFPINTFPHRVSPQIRALCGLLRRIAISVSSEQQRRSSLTRLGNFERLLDGQPVLANLEAKYDSHNIMNKFLVNHYQEIYVIRIFSSYCSCKYYSYNHCMCKYDH